MVLKFAQNAPFYFPKNVQLACNAYCKFNFIQELVTLMLHFCRSLDCDSSGICPDINTCPICENSGTCQDAINGYSCQCILGYTGRHCETNIDECQEVECLVSHLAESLQKQTSLSLNLFMRFSLIAYSLFSFKVAFLNLNEA